MSRTHNDVWSDINNPNNSATMDDWANCNNPNNSIYIEDDYYEHGDSGKEAYSPSIINYENKSYKNFEGQVEQKVNGKWSVTISDGNENICSDEYDSADECMDAMEEMYPGCRLSYPPFVVKDVGVSEHTQFIIDMMNKI